MTKGVRGKKNRNLLILVFIALSMGVFSSFPGSEALAQSVPTAMVQKEWKMPMGLSGHKGTDSQYPNKDVIIRVRHTDYGLGFGVMRVGGKIETAIIIDTTKTGGKPWTVTDRACTQIIGPDGKLRSQRNWYIGGNGGSSVATGYKTILKRPEDIGLYNLLFWRNIFKNNKWGGRKFFTTQISVIGLHAAPPKRVGQDKESVTGICFDVLEALLLPMKKYVVITETKSHSQASKSIGKDPKEERICPKKDRTDYTYEMGISPGSYELVAWAPCYLPQRIRVIVPRPRPGIKGSGIAHVKLRMMPSFQRVIMRVLDPQGRPVRGAKINALNLPGQKPFLSASTNAKGETWMNFQESGPIPDKGGKVIFNVVRNNRVVATFNAFIRFAHCNTVGDPGALLPSPPAYLDTSKKPYVMVLALPSQSPGNPNPQTRVPGNRDQKGAHAWAKRIGAFTSTAIVGSSPRGTRASHQQTRVLQNKIVGRWNWFNGSVGDFLANGTVDGNPEFIWTVTDPVRRIITISWRGRSVDTLTLSRDGFRLNGQKQNGQPVWGERTDSPAAQALRKKIVGRWNWFNGSTGDFLANGTIDGNPAFVWLVTNSAARIVTISWRGLTVDTLTLSPDGQRLEGKNNKGEKVWGEKVSKATTAKPNDADAYYNRGNARRKQGNLSGAIADYSKAIALRPNFAKAYNNRGISHQFQKDYEGAIADYSKAIALSPKFADAYYNRGVARQAQRDYRGAIADYNKTIALSPNYAEAYGNRAITLVGLGRMQEALASAQQGVELDPSGRTKNRAILAWVKKKMAGK